MNDITIQSPRFRDRRVLIEPQRVRDGLNRVIFSTKLPNMLINAQAIRGCPIENGVFAVPLSLFSSEKQGQVKSFNRRSV